MKERFNYKILVPCNGHAILVHLVLFRPIPQSYRHYTLMVPNNILRVVVAIRPSIVDDLSALKMHHRGKYTLLKQSIHVGAVLLLVPLVSPLAMRLVTRHDGVEHRCESKDFCLPRRHLGFARVKEARVR